MTRIPCPTCSCNFINQQELFPDLTGAKAQKELGNIKTRNTFVSWITKNRISITWNESELVFPRGICKSVQNKIRKKANELGINLDSGGLFSSTHHLNWNDDDWLRGVAWNPKPEELHLDD